MSNPAKTKSADAFDFSSTVFPTAEDIALWEGMSEEERLTWIEEREAQAFRSGVQGMVSKDEIMKEVLDEAIATRQPHSCF